LNESVKIQVNNEKVHKYTNYVLLDTVPHRHQTNHKFNLFPPDNMDDLEEEEDREGIIATRLYILLLLIGLLIIVLYFCLMKHTQQNTILFPTQSQFEQLKSLHLSSLVCPCSRLSTSYAKIMSVSPHYHQVCSSEFLQKYWLSYFGNVELDIENIGFITLDFRISGQSFFSLIKILCQTAKDIVEDALHVFQSNRLITIDTLSHEQFNNETTKHLKQFLQKTIASFVNLIDLIRSSIQTNHLISEMWTNAGPRSVFDNQTSEWSLHFRPRNFFTNSCSCALSNQCTRPLGFYFQSDNVYSSPDVTVPGLVVGCYPIDSVLLSTLECLYEWQCIKRIIDMYDFDVIGMVRPLDSHIANIRPLRKEKNSRFPPNTTMESIVAQLFIENWIPSSNFSVYYAHCAPKQCTYNVQQHHHILYILAVMLGFLGGFSAVLETILLFIVRAIRQRRLKRQRQSGDSSITTNVTLSKKVLV
jgi:hypothetical protein